MVFRMFLAFLMFDLNWPFPMGYSFCVGKEQIYCSCRMVFTMFLAFLFFDPNWPFCKGYGRFSRPSYFSNIWCFLDEFSAQNKSSVLVEWFFAYFWHFYFLTQTDHFAKAIIPFAWTIAFARWSIFKIVSFLEYLLFFQAVFCTQQP